MSATGGNYLYQRIGKTNPVVLNTVVGLFGGVVGGVISELIQFKNGEETRFFADSLKMSTALWFMLAMLGIGLSLTFVDGLQARNVEKSLFDTFRAMPLVALGGALSGWIAQLIYGELLKSGSGDVRTARVIGWGIAGLLGGSSVGLGYRSLIRARNGAIGGLVGGLVAGFLFDPLARSISSDSATIPRILGFALIGTLMGGAIAYINSVTSTASLRLVTSEGLGPEIILFNQVSTIGCARQSTVLITNDPAVTEEHVRLEKTGNQISFTCLRNSAPIELNGTSASSGMLSNGDKIRVGNLAVYQISLSKQKTPGAGIAAQQAPIPSAPPPRATIPMRNSGETQGFSTQTPQTPQTPPSGQVPQRPTIQIKRPDNS